ncbi:polysaccharide biosynthesis/export family protein [Salinibius halmophilus]|uniref:polysaccharide biosynthesis/export family protein n=1 Tax=Salinibius halmophilus TaxID=1853216 RepID=UPI000E66BCFF|nr:polysaccharide biosynthesis/export family protein [Salinibius halmophilus]
MLHTLRQLTLLLVAAALLAACASGVKTSQLPTSLDTESIEVATQPYVVGVGDELSIHVWRNPELSPSVTVRPDGYITMPLLGDIEAVGKKPEALAATIDRLLSRDVRNPRVTVIVNNPVSVQYLNRVTITGEVNQPTALAHSAGMTVLDLLLAGGNNTEFAARKRATLSRLIDGEYQEFKVDLAAITERGDMTTNYLLQAGDVLNVPRKSIWRGEL